MNHTKLLMHEDYKSLPLKGSFSVFLLGADGEAFPKRIFTVSEVRMNPHRECVELYIVEEKHYIKWDPKFVRVAEIFLPN